MEEERKKISISESPEFSTAIDGINPNDPVHYIQMNNIIKRLLENDGVLKKTIEQYFGISSDKSLQLAEGIKADNIVDAINEVFTLGNEKKQKLVENLIAMGKQASTEETWEALLDKVLDMMDTSQDTVMAAVLLDGYTAHDATGEQITGEMPELASTTVDTTGVTQDEEYTYLGVPAGHYNEDSKVRALNSNIKTEISVIANVGGNLLTHTAVLDKDYDTVYVFASSGDSNNGGYLTVSASGLSLTGIGAADNQNYYHARNYVAKNCKKGSSVSVKGSWNTSFFVIGI